MIIRPPSIDLVMITRDDRPLRKRVAESIRRQHGVQIRFHRVLGTPRPTDPNRWATIARARNSAAGCGDSPWVMFLDDDVVLAPDCVARLHQALSARADHAALAADYLGEARSRSIKTPHVSMGATLFRRSVLQRYRFRWEGSKCECLCCCEDLRRHGFRIGYLPTARAEHLKKESAPSPDAQHHRLEPADPPPAEDAKVLVAFNRRDVHRFRDAFLRTLRASGNHQEVIVVGYGLYPSERRLLSGSSGVHVMNRPVNGQMPPVRRLHDFGEIVSQLPPQTPVAYWDAGDVVFQDRLEPLWRLTRQYPDKLLAVREPKGFPHNQAIFGWTLSIRHPAKRRRAFELFRSRPFLNSGFAAGTAAAMGRYFREANRLRHSADLRGTSDWGDQSALNLYCHSDQDRWQEIPEGWNYCVHDRGFREVQCLPSGRFVSSRNTPIHVVHGNARSLAKLAIIRSVS